MKFKTFEQFKKILTEGGHATTDTRPIKQYEVPETLKHLEKNLFKKLNLNDDEYCLLGSAGKKASPEDVSGDIDMAIFINKIASTLECDFTEVGDKLNIYLEKLGFTTNYSRGFGIISISYPIQSKEGGNVQLDLMLSDDIEWSKFIWHSPDFRLTKSKYKGLYRNILLFSIVSSYIFKETKAEEDIGNLKKGDVLEVDKLTLDMKKGLTRTVKSYKGKKPNTLVKTPKTLEAVLLTKNPIEFIHTVIGDSFTVADLDNFESLLVAINNPKFKNYKNRDSILKDYVERLKENEFPIPKEVENFK